MSDAFELPQELNIYSALETRDSLLAWVAAQASQSKGALEISARHVAEIDGAGLQLLAALDNMEQPWHVVATSTAFSEACTTMGFGAWIDASRLHSTGRVAA
jgi:ABC-type transporter Mla MlaB component